MRLIPPPLCITAQTENELLPKLGEVVINMPERGERDTRHGERYAIVHFLRYLCSIGELAYPLKLEQRERPDFLLTINGVTIGIEHTEAVAQNQAHEDARRGALGLGDFASFDDRHMPDDRPRSSKEIDARLTRKKECFEALKPNQDRLQGDDDYKDVIGEGWAGDEPEVEWAEWMRHCIKDKNKNLSAPDWDRFNHNWLLKLIMSVRPRSSLPTSRLASTRYLFCAGAKSVESCPEATSVSMTFQMRCSTVLWQL